ncbi:MAG: response regulator [Planctomycetes bacterium]|nr:response regulator [Planctomycetota bacterium]MBI3848150.1 response regulator [Planctomycetota bacterium]
MDRGDVHRHDLERRDGHSRTARAAALENLPRAPNRRQERDPRRSSGKSCPARTSLQGVRGRSAGHRRSDDFVPDVEVHLVVALRNETDSHATIRFDVKDTGIGIRGESLSRLFSAFEQEDPSTTRRYGGTGLGLAISKRLVEMMNGEISVESEHGKGSTFWFALTLEKRPQCVDRSENDAALLEGIRVLVADDNATNRMILRDELLSWKMRDAAADANGRDALTRLTEAAASHDPYRIAIVDAQMPDIDGVTLARRINGDPAIRSVKLVMMTELCVPTDISELRRAGIDAWLIKPVKQGQLLRALTGAVAGRPTDVSARPGVANESGTAVTKALKILLAEDNRVNQIIAVRQLKKLGYKADVVANGIEVLEALERIAYDVIFMDCHMPEMDGYEAARRIRELPGARSRVKIIAMTANAMQGDREQCLNAGMDDYVSKPARIDDLQRAIANLEDGAST